MGIRYKVFMREEGWLYLAIVLDICSRGQLFLWLLTLQLMQNMEIESSIYLMEE